MGNTTSKPQGDGATSFPPSPTSLGHDGTATVQSDTTYTVRRRASNIGKTTAAPPSASLESAVGHSSQLRHSPLRSRPRSQTAAPALEYVQADSSASSRQHVTDSQTLSTGGSVPNALETSKIDAASRGSADSSTLELSGRSESEENYFVTPSQFVGPPRLPLPIEEELLAPGSPIISPADLEGTLDDTFRGDLPRKSSTLSSTTVDDEETTEDYQHASLDGNAGPLIPTLLEWKHGGKEVFVTGTFIGWNRKYKLHKDGPVKESSVHSAIIGLPPGTHHITFLVDQQMHTSPDMPTAVDFTNALVNWIEVSADAAQTDVERAERRTSATATPDLASVASPQLQHDTKDVAEEREVAIKSVNEESAPPKADSTTKRAEAPKPRLPPKIYHFTVPRVLIDLDASESSSRFARANTAVSTYPTPPSLPMFLNKSILNGSTPMKDDASVLIMPNHTVLNHLATSSIKNNVLATSATTRYKQKFLTTIMYKPTSDIHE